MTDIAPTVVAPLPSLEEELEAAADDVFTQAFPLGLPPARGRNNGKSAIVMGFPLEASHLAKLADHAASGESLGVRNASLKDIRHTHHQLARLLALGVDEVKAARVCNYSPSRVSVLKSDPAFIEVLNYYSTQVDDAFVDVVETIKGLSLGALQELSKRLEEKPESLTNTHLIELSKAMLDRSGNGPSSTTNVNARIATVSATEIARIKAGPGHVQRPLRNLPPASGPAAAVGHTQREPAVRDPEVPTDDPIQLDLFGEEGTELDGGEEGGDLRT